MTRLCMEFWLGWRIVVSGAIHRGTLFGRCVLLSAKLGCRPYITKYTTHYLSSLAG